MFNNNQQRIEEQKTQAVSRKWYVLRYIYIHVREQSINKFEDKDFGNTND